MDVAEQQVPDGYKQTEVGVIPEDWTAEYIKDAFDICNTLRLPLSRKVRETMQGKYPYYGPTRIQDYLNEYRVEGEYALIGEDGDHFLKYERMPQTQMARGRFNVNNHAHLILGKKNLTEWFYCFFRNRDISLFLTRQGAGRFKLSKGSLENLPCALPPVGEQKLIVAALSDVDALITSLEKFIAKKRAIKTGAMQQLLTGKKRLPPFDQNHTGYKKTELGEIPEDWELVLLSDVVDVRDGTHESPSYQENGVPLITSKNIVGNRLFLESASYISFEDAMEVNKRSQVHVGDILMSMIGTIGSAVLVKEKPNYCIKNIALFKPKKISGEFLIQLVSSSYFQDLLVDSLDGGIQKFISLGSLRGLKIISPPKEEQLGISEVLVDIQSEVEELEHRLTKTQHLKHGMMQELLTGRTRLI